jgi:predicted nicotinamide N-methyase
MRIDRETLRGLLERHAPLRPVEIAPELFTWHAEDELPLWEALEQAAAEPLEPPFFAVAWPAGQALARLILDGAIDVAARSVADVGCGSGVVAFAAAKRGARVSAIDRDPLALAACDLASVHNGVVVDLDQRDVFAEPNVAADVVLAGDLIYHRHQLEPAMRALAVWRARSVVYLADGGRPHFDALRTSGLRETLFAELDVPAPRKVEGASSRRVRVYRIERNQ